MTRYGAVGTFVVESRWRAPTLTEMRQATEPSSAVADRSIVNVRDWPGVRTPEKSGDAEPGGLTSTQQLPPAVATESVNGDKPTWYTALLAVVAATGNDPAGAGAL